MYSIQADVSHLGTGSGVEFYFITNDDLLTIAHMTSL